jgi:hypothetical protein
MYSFCQIRFRGHGKTGQQAMEVGWVDGQVVFPQLVNQFIKIVTHQVLSLIALIDDTRIFMPVL